jgi:hypothetical protein
VYHPDPRRISRAMGACAVMKIHKSISDAECEKNLKWHFLIQKTSENRIFNIGMKIEDADGLSDSPTRFTKNTTPVIIYILT